MTTEFTFVSSSIARKFGNHGDFDWNLLNMITSYGKIDESTFKCTLSEVAYNNQPLLAELILNRVPDEPPMLMRSYAEQSVSVPENTATEEEIAYEIAVKNNNLEVAEVLREFVSL